jgi:hypothetical protein
VFKSLLKKKASDVTFRCRIDNDDIILELTAGETLVPFERWSELKPEATPALNELRALAGHGEAPEVIVEADALRISAPALARLDAAVSAELGLPPPTRLALDLRPREGIQSPDFHVRIRWVLPGGIPEKVSVHGAAIKTANGLQRIPEPLFSLYQAAQALAAPIADAAARYQALAELKAHWPEDPDLPVLTDGYLSDLRIHYASAVSVKLTALTPEKTEFEPLLFGAKALAESEEDDRALDEDQDSLLTSTAQRRFGKQLFYAGDGRKAAYVLGTGEYIYIDPAVRPVLGEIRRLQGSPEAERRSFVLNPAGQLRERLGAEIADRIGLERLFVETEQFSERVSGVDVWRKAVLPWLTPLGKNQWIPERFGLRIGDDYFAIAPQGAATLIDRVEAARVAEAPQVDVGDLLQAVEESGSPPPPFLGMNDQTYAAVESLRPFAVRFDAQAGELENDADAPPWDAAQGKLFLIVRNNFEEVEYAPAGPDEEAASPVLDLKLPDTLKTSAKPHQKDGIRWLATCASIGRPGALLADDMGLGKTLQAIAFMAWLQDEARLGRRDAAPFLIVAPTGLLGNWQSEIRKHLEEPGLGIVARAFGGDLKRLREESGLAGRDIETGRASLDSGAWRNAGVVLTTYETVRDYHFSFARTRFGLIVYDEIQKLKNPTSQMSRAARALNSDFVLGMTGTPVENRLQDLWSIMDVLTPGLLGSSRDFERKHPPENREALAGLKAQLMDTVPPYMVRRLKSEALEGLPRKTVVPYRLDMPPIQAEAYKDVVIRAAAAAAAGTLGKGGMLTYLAAMRGVSLHPRNPRDAVGDLETYAAESARLECAFRILDEAKSKNEKVLVFVEDLAMQDRFAQLVQERYSLARRPMQINGGVPGLTRQRMVDVFQSEPGRFDVMVLSPKAGGVGLTITAANHVIHLSRWWNPAVEDQATDRVFRIGQTKDVFVHVPMAVHPEGALRDSSFDLRLNALIERKRTLTRDLFLPPDASDADLANLFEDVSLSRSEGPDERTGAEGDLIPPSSAATDTDAGPPSPIAVELPAQPPELAATPPAEASAEKAVASRPILGLPKELQKTGAQVWIRGAGDSRPTAEILDVFKGRRINRATISDPYAIASATARQAQIRFISDLAEVARLQSVVIEYAPDIDYDFDDARARSDIGTLFGQSSAAGKGVTLLPKRRNKRGRHDDFHDRQVTFEIEHAGGAVKVHTLVIGRGLEALYDDRWQCSVSYAPPSA